MFFNKKSKQYSSIDPDEIFVDSANLPGFDINMFEGRIEKPIQNRVLFFIIVFFLIFVLIFSGKLFSIQILSGEENSKISQNNRLHHTYVFADRGIIYDRFREPLAWNENNSDEEFELRKYTDRPGMAHILGYISYPKKDNFGFYFDTEVVGVSGSEKFFNQILAGTNGLKIMETNATFDLVSDSVLKDPQNGESIMLTIDADLQENLFLSIKNIVDQVGFRAGAGAIMDIHTGDIISMTSYPEFEPDVLTEGKDNELIADYISNPRNIFLNRFTQGLYTPGSIMKPFVALGALEEGVVNRNTIIESTGRMVVPNPYNPSNPSIFTDWKAHGRVNLLEALAYSSNIYFYQVGGGFGTQRGIGIEKINYYFKEFGFGEDVDNEFFNFNKGVIPDPKWKEEVFDDIWRVGDTYFTAIGQYGVTVTPVQTLRAFAALANNGMLVEPRILVNSSEIPKISQRINISQNSFNLVKEGMRDAVLYGTARGLNSSNYKIAAKTGTAELGDTKEKVNSWLVGFFPYDNPRYAFTIVLEQGDRTNLIGGVAVARNFFDWLYFNHPKYLE